MLNATQISDDVFFTLLKAEQIEAARMLRLQRISANCAIDPQRLADWHERQAAGIEFIPENSGGAGVRLRRFKIGDRVVFRPQTADRPTEVGVNEVGTVVYVEPSPPQTSAGYTVQVQFSDHKPLTRWGHEFRFAETGASLA